MPILRPVKAPAPPGAGAPQHSPGKPAYRVANPPKRTNPAPAPRRNLLGEPLNGPRSRQGKQAGDDAKFRALECVLCTRRFGKDEIAAGLFQLSTLICSHCYARMQRAPHAQACFGKPTCILPNGTRAYGYNPAARECRDVCPDRDVCRKVFCPDIPV